MENRIIISIIMLIFSNLSFGQSICDLNSNIISQYFNLKPDSNLSNVLLSNILNDNSVSVEILQKGDFNFSSIKSKSEDNQRIIQNGNANFYEISTYYNSIPSEIQLVQNGNNNSLFIYGQNEISNQIQIIQNSNNQMLIIKNY